MRKLLALAGFIKLDDYGLRLEGQRVVSSLSPGGEGLVGWRRDDLTASAQAVWIARPAPPVPVPALVPIPVPVAAAKPLATPTVDDDEDWEWLLALAHAQAEVAAPVAAPVVAPVAAPAPATVIPVPNLRPARGPAFLPVDAMPTLIVPRPARATPPPIPATPPKLPSVALRPAGARFPMVPRLPPANDRAATIARVVDEAGDEPTAVTPPPVMPAPLPRLSARR